MSKQDDVTDDTTNVTDDDNDNGQDTSVTDTEDVETLKAQLAEKDKQNTKLFERAKKAEGFEKQPDGSWVKPQKKPEVKSDPKPTEVAKTNDGLTSMDAIVLMGAKVTEKEDIEFVAEYAQFKKISIADALKSSVVKSELAEKSEVRATAAATNTGNARRGTSKPTDEQIVNNASEGKDVDPEALAEARFNIRKSKK
jgi:hypothetical protein